MAAPRALRSAGLIAVGSVDGARIFVDDGKTDTRFEAILGVCDVPPDRIIYMLY